VVNLNDYPSIPKTQPLQSLECQTPVFVDSNDHVTQNHTSNHAFDIISPRIKAHNFLGIRGKPNKKIVSKNHHLFRESPSIAKVIKKYS
jgi:hypothetical protein